MGKGQGISVPFPSTTSDGSLHVHQAEALDKAAAVPRGDTGWRLSSVANGQCQD